MRVRTSRSSRAHKCSESVGWYYSDDLEYLTFKRLACFVATRFVVGVSVDIDKVDKKVAPEQAYIALRDITDNRHEAEGTAGWVDDQARHNEIRGKLRTLRKT